ncbi:hypothetical protein MKJ04_09075 [Pontibacter sp. E15-1]|uniref:hypothetical protein n=1 Tax=Pontibacter sp. E15-1 TaxID=2919918 RepID=UPI001F4FFB65|nr:hypothetical protein [Pontibacter sp. E15-1]MCJ8164996.1 hypothetical protein [Pontibacter sp. E15-1]
MIFKPNNLSLLAGVKLINLKESSICADQYDRGVILCPSISPLIPISIDDCTQPCLSNSAIPLLGGVGVGYFALPYAQNLFDIGITLKATPYRIGHLPG